eukprot:TRINITY_DN31701_c0_g1_i1.p1 TRINITY_DN31701_c0_g1~~TRINITY_DN31701_c0_g1_i1.p1  ORF type:complete len:476 (+),score=57.31 TRINITY_DN31701_c0_g1_i1:57-1484(+)
MKTRILCLVAIVTLLAYVSWESFSKHSDKDSPSVVVITNTTASPREVEIAASIPQINDDNKTPFPSSTSFDPPTWSPVQIPSLPADATKTNIGPITSGGKQVKGIVHWSSNTCLGYVMIFRPSCSDDQTVVSRDDKWNSYLRSVRGPDWFRVNIEGDDVTFMVPMSYLDSCKYIGIIPKVKGVNLRVTIKWETDNYLGVTELVQTVTSFREKYLTRATSFGDCKSDGEFESQQRNYYHKGNDNALSRYPWSQPVKGIEWVWGTGLTSTAACNDKTIIFVGDSQLRSTWRHWEAILKRKQPELAKTFKSDEVYLRGHRVAYFFDPFMERLFSDNITKIINEGSGKETVIVFGFGAWAANIIPGWSHQKFVSTVTTIFNQISKNNQANVRYLWLGTPAWPKPRRNSDGFRITNARLSLWNQLCSQLAKSAGVKTIDFYGISYPHIKMNRDQIHFDNSIIMYSVIEQVANQFCNPTLS